VSLSVYTNVSLGVYVSVYASDIASVNLCVYVCVSLSVYVGDSVSVSLSVSLSVYAGEYISVNLVVYINVSLSVYAAVYVRVYVSVYVRVYISVYASDIVYPLPSSALSRSLPLSLVTLLTSRRPSSFPASSRYPSPPFIVSRSLSLSLVIPRYLPLFPAVFRYLSLSPVALLSYIIFFHPFYVFLLSFLYSSFILPHHFLPLNLHTVNSSIIFTAYIRRHRLIHLIHRFPLSFITSYCLSPFSVFSRYSSAVFRSFSFPLTIFR
jgi:hypothetical protein